MGKTQALRPGKDSADAVGDVGAEFERLKLEVMGLEVAHHGQVVQVLVGPTNGAWVSHGARLRPVFWCGFNTANSV